jgi:hypothetical protein
VNEEQLPVLHIFRNVNFMCSSNTETVLTINVRITEKCRHYKVYVKRQKRMVIGLTKKVSYTESHNHGQNNDQEASQVVVQFRVLVMLVNLKQNEESRN